MWTKLFVSSQFWFVIVCGPSSYTLLSTTVAEVLSTIEKVLFDVLDQKVISEAQFLVPDNYGEFPSDVDFNVATKLHFLTILQVNSLYRSMT